MNASPSPFSLSSSPAVRLSGVPVGADHPPVFLAEIGTFFNQDLAVAEAMADRLADIARQAPDTPLLLKGEVLHDPDVCLDDDTMENYVAKDGRKMQERYRALVERKIVPLERYRALYALAARRGLNFVLSVYDFAGADFAVEIGAAGVKIASANLTNLPLIRHAAAKGAPLVIDTGRAALDEVARAVQAARAAGATDIIVEHSPDGHPARPKAHNLRILQTYAQAFETPVGLSDHHVDEEMLYVAVALGAGLVEKGVTFDAEALEQDAAHAMALDDLPRALRRVGNAWRALGRSRRDPTMQLQGNVGTSQRSGLVARRALVPGDKLDLETVRFAWPAKGVPVQHWDTVAGWTVTEPIPAGAVIEWRHVRCVQPG